MKQKEKGEIQNTSPEAEKKFLEQTISVVQSNLENYGRQVSEKKREIDEMLEHFHDDNPELINLLENTITLHDHMKRALERNEKALCKPYFGRIVFYDYALGKSESLYIGKGGISRDATHQVVIDWRAPVANAYYENGLGECSYTAPGGRQIQIDLELKRTYEIEDGKLLDYFDSEVVANDDLLTKYLAKNKQAVLGEIVATIQKEQNEIIRKSPYHNIIVQGVAGSGKTTVAMHRISFILYNYQERFRPEDFYIIGSNRILLNYITGVLPDLDVQGVRQMTMEELFVRLLYEDWDEKKFHIKKGAQNGAGSIKGSSVWFQDLKAYCDGLEWDGILRDSVYLNPKQFVEGLRDGKSGVYDETGGKEAAAEVLVLLADREAVERYIHQNPKVSMQSKINMLNERLLGKIKEEFLGKGVKYTERERKAILKAYRNRYGGKEWKGSIYKVYGQFLAHQIAEHKIEPIALPDGKNALENLPGQDLDVYDLAALAYIYKRIKETEVISEAHHIVIDEAQDYGMMAYLCLDFCIYGCTYTVMGDVSQNIHFGFGLNDWEELRGLLLPNEMDSFGVLKKSYRNTVEISDFATNILHHGKFSSYPVEPIIRHGDPVMVRQSADGSLFREAAEICKTWQERGFDTIAVVCRNQESADRTAKELGAYVNVLESDLEKAVFANGIMVLPVEYTKGLEFDTVLILNPTREEYPVDDGHAKLLYVAATRALHELCVLHTGELTGLIADPLPQNPQALSKSAFQENRPVQEKDLPQNTGENTSMPNSRKTTLSQDAGDTLSRQKIVLQNAGGTLPYSGNAQAAARNGKRPAAKAPGVTASKMQGIQTAQTVDKQNIHTVQSTDKQNIHTVQGTDKQSTPSGGKQSPQAAKAKQNAARPVFGDIPATESLRLQGHSRIDLSVRWVTKQQDGLYLQSRYGILRLSPVGSAIIRVTFTKSGQPDRNVHPGIAVNRVEKFWMYKDAASAVELTTDELLLRVDKNTGAMRCMRIEEKNPTKATLLAERSKECRQMEELYGKRKVKLFLDWAKDERLYSFGPGKQAGISLRGNARYISQNPPSELPFLLSDKGYALLMATSSPVFCCDMPAYGSYLCIEEESQLDYYLIAGKRQETLLNAYTYLCGTQ